MPSLLKSCIKSASLFWLVAALLLCCLVVAGFTPSFTFFQQSVLLLRVHTPLTSNSQVTNSQFAEFVASSGYETESERFGWSFVFDLALTRQAKQEIDTAVQGAEWWLPVQV